MNVLWVGLQPMNCHKEIFQVEKGQQLAPMYLGTKYLGTQYVGTQYLGTECFGTTEWDQD